MKYPEESGTALLPFLLHIRDQFQHAVQEGKEGEGRAGKADACDRDICAEKAAQPCTGADAQIEDAGEDGHGDGGFGAGSDLNGLCLQSDVEGGRGHAPEDAEGADGVEISCKRIEEGKRDDEEEDRHRKEGIAVRVIELREEEAAEKSGKAEDGEKHGDPVSREVRDLQHERLDVAVAGVVTGGDKEGEEENACEDFIFEKFRNVFHGKRRIAGDFREQEEEVGECHKGNDGHAGESHAPSGSEPDEAAHGKSENHGNGCPGDDHAHGSGLVRGRHDARRDGGCDGPEDGVGESDADTGGKEGVVARRNRREYL